MELSEINWSLLAPLIVIQLILIIIALSDCIRKKNTNGPKWIWILAICTISIIGPVSYFIFGRKADE